MKASGSVVVSSERSVTDEEKNQKRSLDVATSCNKD